MKKRISGILISFGLMLALMPVLGMIMPVHAYDESPYKLWVCGVAVTDENREDVLSDGVVSFTPATGRGAATLTLKGNVTADPERHYYDAAIRCDDGEHDLIIDAEKPSVVKGPDYDDPYQMYSYGIVSEGPLTVRGKLEAAGGEAEYGYGIYGHELVVDHGAEVKASGNDAAVEITNDTNGIVEVKGKLTADSEYIGIIIDSDSDGLITVKDGAELTAAGMEMVGIGGDDNIVVVTIEKGAKVSAVGGKYGAINGIAKNAVEGIGWTVIEGTEIESVIEINSEEGQDLSSFSKVQFPKPAASVKTRPTARSLAYDGTAQALVTAGTASDGIMQYALSPDASDVAPESGWSENIPTGTEAKTYYVWYMVNGDRTHTDSDPEGPVAVTISKAKATVRAKDQSISVGDAVPDLSSPVLNVHYTVEGLVGGDALTTAPKLRYASQPDNTKAGTYEIAAGGADAGGNYEFSYQNGTLTISEKQTPGSSSTNADDPAPVGTVHKAGAGTYVVKSAKTVWLKKPAKNKTKFTVPAKVKIKGKTFSVTGIDAKAFKGKKVKTLTVTTKKLTKKSVKGSLKGSKIKTIKVKVGKKKLNKKYVKEYKKIFTKKNAGRKVKIS